MSQKSDKMHVISITFPNSNIFLQKKLAANSGKTLKKWTDRSKYLGNGKKKA